MAPPPRPASPRRLPVLQNTDAEDDQRPRWHWIPIGAAFGLSIWLPVAMLTTWLGRLVTTAMVPSLPLDAVLDHLAAARAWERGVLGVALFVLPLLGFAVALGCAGVLVGRFGTRVEARDAAWSGVMAAVFGAALTAWSAGPGAAAAGLLILLPDGAVAGYLGGRLGVRLRRQSATRVPPAVGR